MGGLRSQELPDLNFITVPSLSGLTVLSFLFIKCLLRLVQLELEPVELLVLGLGLVGVLFSLHSLVESGGGETVTRLGMLGARVVSVLLEAVATLLLLLEFPRQIGYPLISLVPEALDFGFKVLSLRLEASLELVVCDLSKGFGFGLVVGPGFESLHLVHLFICFMQLLGDLSELLGLFTQLLVFVAEVIERIIQCIPRIVQFLTCCAQICLEGTDGFLKGWRVIAWSDGIKGWWRIARGPHDR